MTETLTVPRPYRAALDELQAAAGEARDLADLLTYFADLLRGERPAPEGPPLEAFPHPTRVRRALERIDRALDEAGNEWRRLPVGMQGLLPPPEDLLGG
jgi:hypothetical protein